MSDPSPMANDVISHVCAMKLPSKPKKTGFRELLGLGTRTLPCPDHLSRTSPYVSVHLAVDLQPFCKKSEPSE